MNAAKREDDLWERAGQVIADLYPNLKDWRVRMMAGPGGLTLWSGSRGELLALFENSDFKLGEVDVTELLDVFEQEQTDTIDPLPGHHLVVMESQDGERRVVVNVLSAALTPQHEQRPQNRLSMADVDRAIVRESYTILPSGRSVACELTLHNGHVEAGIAHVIDSHNFDFEAGKKAAKAKAIDGVFRILAHDKREFIRD